MCSVSVVCYLHLSDICRVQQTATVNFTQKLNKQIHTLLLDRLHTCDQVVDLLVKVLSLLCDG